MKPFSPYSGTYHKWSVDTSSSRLHPTQTCIFQSDIHYTYTNTHTLSHIPWIQNIVKVKKKSVE